MDKVLYFFKKGKEISWQPGKWMLKLMFILPLLIFMLGGMPLSALPEILVSIFS
jgi:hypothetical protein